MFWDFVNTTEIFFVPTSLLISEFCSSCLTWTNLICFTEPSKQIKLSPFLQQHLDEEVRWKSDLNNFRDFIRAVLQLMSLRETGEGPQNACLLPGWYKFRKREIRLVVQRLYERVLAYLEIFRSMLPSLDSRNRLKTKGKERERKQQNEIQQRCSAKS